MADSPFPVFQRGEWPGPVTLRRGWARAVARPWNDHEPDASLRLVRGGPGFLAACTDRLFTIGVPSIFSPPLPGSSRKPWEEVGYREFAPLALFRLALDTPPRSPDHLVVDGASDELDDLLAIDQAAFDPFWRFDRHGLDEALRATGTSIVLTIRDGDGSPAAFAIVGFGHALAYLQRVAVHPRWQGQGMGRSLVRVAARKARSRGAKAMLLNTQFDNRPAIALYEKEGFTLLPDALVLMRAVA